MVEGEREIGYVKLRLGANTVAAYGFGAHIRHTDHSERPKRLIIIGGKDQCERTLGNMLARGQPV